MRNGVDLVNVMDSGMKQFEVPKTGQLQDLFSIFLLFKIQQICWC